MPQDDIKKATGSQISLSRDAKSLTTAGWILAAIVLSVANRKLAIRILTTTRSQIKPWIFRGGAGSLGSSLPTATAFLFSKFFVFLLSSLAIAGAVYETELLEDMCAMVGLAFRRGIC